MTINTARRAAVCMAALGMIASLSPAQSKVTRDELKSRFEQRYPRLSQLERAGEVGETWQGFVAAVTEGGVASDVRRVIEDENRDRQTLYAIIAEDVRADTEPSRRSEITAEVIAFRNARRNFENAGEREQLRVAEKTWVTKKERPWLLNLLDMLGEGKIGETSTGSVEAVTEAYARDSRVQKVVDQENRARRERDERLAAAEGITVERVGERQAQRYFESARPGVYLKRDGRWTRKRG